jgi:DNA modification methylase
MSVIRADARALPIVDGCVQTCVTSPPYWGLRDYGNSDQIGLEATPEAYVAQLVAVFADVRRVLKPDGTLWLNLGDSYSGNGLSGGDGSKAFGGTRPDKVARHAAIVSNAAAKRTGLKPKDLVGIPWRVAFALQADGWYLRSDIIWSKSNPMPESVTDRPTKAHEYIFLLAKSPRYYYDVDAIAEPYARPYSDGPGFGGFANRANTKSADLTAAMPTLNRTGFGPNARVSEDATRNKRSVWHIATQPYPEAHFATFPPALVEPCILAGSRPGDLVLDPFLGSGTVGQVCERFGRRWVGTDLTYQHLSKGRTAQRGLRFLEADPVADSFYG